MKSQSDHGEASRLKKKKPVVPFTQRSGVCLQGTKYLTKHHGIGNSKFRYVDGKTKSIISI
jgi:hypothetical protein